MMEAPEDFTIERMTAAANYLNDETPLIGGSVQTANIWKEEDGSLYRITFSKFTSNEDALFSVIVDRQYVHLSNFDQTINPAMLQSIPESDSVTKKTIHPYFLQQLVNEEKDNLVSVDSSFTFRLDPGESLKFDSAVFRECMLVFDKPGIRFTAEVGYIATPGSAKRQDAKLLDKSSDQDHVSHFTSETYGQVSQQDIPKDGLTLQLERTDNGEAAAENDAWQKGLRSSTVHVRLTEDSRGAQVLSCKNVGGDPFTITLRKAKQISAPELLARYGLDKDGKPL